MASESETATSRIHKLQQFAALFQLDLQLIQPVSTILIFIHQPSVNVFIICNTFAHEHNKTRVITKENEQNGAQTDTALANNAHHTHIQIQSLKHTRQSYTE